MDDILSSRTGQSPSSKLRNHYAALDGLRGIAAISVLLFHLGHWQQQPWLAGNASLAVDFFFTLSGYVLAVAYNSKLAADMSTWQFFKIRMIRLMPTIVFGTLLSAAYLAARSSWLHDSTIDLDELFLATVLGMLSVPMLTASTSIGGPQVFPLNGPQYTLFLELFINWVWVVVRPCRTFWVAAIIAIIGYALTARYGMGGDEVHTFWTGFPRVFAAYYAGTAIFYAQERWPSLTQRGRGAWFWPLLLVSLLLFWWPSTVSSWIGWGWSLVFSPLLVLAGSRVKLSGAARRIALVLGELSYPVYALHFPIFVWVNAAYQTVLHRKEFAIGIMLVVPIVSIGAWSFLKWIDQPVRRRLTVWLSGHAIPAT
jgi:peptidoglycan/LPS O-acetylase OafA/YrhL